VCFGYAIAGNPDGTINSFSADVSVADAITLTAQFANPNPGGIGDSFMWASLEMLAGSTLTINYDLSGTSSGYGASVFVYDCNGNLIDSDNDLAMTDPLTGTFTFTIADAGVYYVACSGGMNPTGGATTGDFIFEIISDDTMVANPVIALWDDSGTTRKLWACPKLLLPPLTELTGDWYASCADAASDISAQVSNCVGYIAGAFDSFTATDGGTSLTLDVATTSPNFPTMWGGVNAETGETISFAFTATATSGTPIVSVWVYDDTGTEIFFDNATATSGTITSSALPYTGRYTVKVTITSTLLMDDVTGTIGITSSGTMSVNPAQARWDAGLTCAALLNCGDSCP